MSITVDRGELCCPECGGFNITGNVSDGIALLRCRACKHSWSEEYSEDDDETDTTLDDPSI